MKLRHSTFGLMAVLLTLNGCFLDSTGLPTGGTTSGNGGGGSTSSGDCQSSGTADGSASTSSSTAGSTASSAAECTTSTGAGGNGGANTGGSGGVGGDGGTTSTSNTGGAGGGEPLGCEAGTEDTPDLLEGWGNEESAGLIVLMDGTTEYQYNDVGGEANKMSYPLTNTDRFPGQLVLTGLNGIHSRLKDGAQDRPQATYLVQGNAIPYPECKGEALYSEVCLALVAKDYRCQNGSNEADCPTPELVYASQGNQAAYDLNFDGGVLLLIDVQCEP